MVVFAFSGLSFMTCRPLSPILLSRLHSLTAWKCRAGNSLYRCHGVHASSDVANQSCPSERLEHRSFLYPNDRPCFLAQAGWPMLRPFTALGLGWLAAAPATAAAGTCLEPKDIVVCRAPRDFVLTERVETWRIGEQQNTAFAVLASDDGSWLVRAFKQKVASGIAGCKATTELEVIAELCGGSKPTSLRWTLSAALPDRSCADVRSWRSNGPEDARLTRWGDGLALFVNDFTQEGINLGPGGYRRSQFVATIRVSSMTLQVTEPRLVRSSLFTLGSQEKNWSPWSFEGRLMVHQWLSDKNSNSIVLELDVDQADVVQTFSCNARGLRSVVGAEILAGGTNAVRINNTHFLAIGHTYHETRTYRIYAMFAYIFEARPPFCICAATTEFHLKPPPVVHGPCATDPTLASKLEPRPSRPDYSKIKGTSLTGNKAIQFPMSLALVHGRVLNDTVFPDASSRTLLVSWGRADRDSFFSSLHLNWFLNHMRPLEPSESH